MMTTAENETIKQMLPTAEVARRLGVSSESVRAWARTGRLATTKTAIGRLVSPDEVERIARERNQAVSV